MPVSFAFTERDGVVIYKDGTPIYRAQNRNDLLRLLGALYFGLIAGKLISIDGTELESIRHQTILVELVGKALAVRYQ